jgi:hypothetical protein
MSEIKVSEMTNITSLPDDAVLYTVLPGGGYGKVTKAVLLSGLSGIESVTGAIVDTTDPANPVINTPSLQQVSDVDNEIISADGKSKVEFTDGSITFFYRVTLGADWTQTAQYSSSQFSLDDSFFYGAYSFKVDPWTGVTVSDAFGNVINITPTSITKNGVEVVTFDDINGKEDKSAKVTTIYGNTTDNNKYPGVKAIVDWVKDLFIAKQMSAYSMMANVSNATANAIEVPFISKGVQNLTGISFVGTQGPTGGTQHYQFEQVGNMVTCIMTGNYANAGVAITQVIIPFPADLPNMTRPAGIAAATGNKCYIVNGNLSTSPTAISLTATSSFVVCATDPSKYNVVGVTSSNGIKHFWFSFTYFTS